MNSSGIVSGVAAGTANITATFQNIASPSLSIQVTQIPLKAAFTVTPNAGLVGNLGQCPVTAAAPVNQLLCTFDGTSSTPVGAITSFQWEIPEGSNNHFSGPTIQSVSIPCGSIPGGGTKNVKLTITGPGGTNPVSLPVTFIKSTPC